MDLLKALDFPEIAPLARAQERQQPQRGPKVSPSSTSFGPPFVCGWSGSSRNCSALHALIAPRVFCHAARAQGAQGERIKDKTSVFPGIDACVLYTPCVMKRSIFASWQLHVH